MKIQPLQDRIIVKRLERPDKTASGLFLPEKAKEPGPVAAEVLAVGPGRTLDDGTVVAMEVKPGDRVLISEHIYGSEIIVNDEKCTLINESDVLALIV